LAAIHQRASRCDTPTLDSCAHVRRAGDRERIAVCHLRRQRAQAACLAARATPLQSGRRLAALGGGNLGAGSTARRLTRQLTQPTITSLNWMTGERSV